MTPEAARTRSGFGQGLWQWLGTHFAGIVLDECVVMPNHVHGIIVRRGMAVEDPPTPIGHDTHADPNTIDITRIRRGRFANRPYGVIDHVTGPPAADRHIPVRNH